ncbi:hypothetical protein BRADI_3g47170v3 [Brachypodium distachyon]|uniref:HMA domain-containing protein n=1 Tax=Brachypodium distachyon TaxID=15368 RepID=A0A2K2D3T5_BRADI|nr:hypothetical protein BRADI_3g47170v3 [Brachypodium distachyon]
MREIIFRIYVKSEKCQTKAMKVAATVSGVESVTLAGGDKSLLLVIGDGVDSNKLSKKLKKKIGAAEIVELRTLDTFEVSPLQHHPHPIPAKGAQAHPPRSPYNNQQSQMQYNYQYGGAAGPGPQSPYNAYHYHPSPMAMAAQGGYGYSGQGEYGYGRSSSYSRMVARSHPGNYSPLMERHDYYPMDHSFSSSAAAAAAGGGGGGTTTYRSVPRREGSSGGCCIL